MYMTGNEYLISTQLFIQHEHKHQTIKATEHLSAFKQHQLMQHFMAHVRFYRQDVLSANSRKKASVSVVTSSISPSITGLEQVRDIQITDH